MVAEEDSTDLRGDDGALLRQRITALVNRVVQESGHPARETLSEAQVLQLIDAGASQVCDEDAAQRQGRCEGYGIGSWADGKHEQTDWLAP